jgi:hypothetical protein
MKGSIIMINVVISPSQQKTNYCKMGDNEVSHTRNIAEKFYNNLKQDKRFNVFLIPIVVGTENQILKQVTDLSDDFIMKNGESGYHISIHTDANDSKSFGATTFFYKTGGKGEYLAKNIQAKIATLTPWSDRGYEARPGLWELKETIASAVLVEISFHDEIIQAKWIHEKSQEIANALTSGLFLTEGFGEYVPPLPDYIVAIKQLNKRMISNGDAIINSPDAWITNLQGATIDSNSAKSLIIKFVKYINEKGV